MWYLLRAMYMYIHLPAQYYNVLGTHALLVHVYSLCGQVHKFNLLVRQWFCYYSQPPLDLEGNDQRGTVIQPVLQPHLKTTHTQLNTLTKKNAYACMSL